MLATRFSQPPMAEPSYDMRHVPRASRGLQGSVVHRIDNDRSVWSKLQPEMLLLCNEAKERRRRRFPDELGCRGSAKPLSMEYIADRIDTDDPTWGYAVRHRPTGALQGFVLMTTFTTWHSSFRWDSLCLEAGLREPDDDEEDDDDVIGSTTNSSGGGGGSGGGGRVCKDDDGFEDDESSAAAKEEEERAALVRWHRARLVDANGSLSRALESELRDGDPTAGGGGNVWPHVAELSLIGALGCGRFLLQLVIDDLQNRTDHPYKFIVLQATEVRPGGLVVDVRVRLLT